MMNIRQLEAFQDKLKLNLKKAGLPTDSRHIIGQQYGFECEHGSHHQILVGTVRAIEISDEGGLNLYVSNPLFWSYRLIGIKHSNGKWMACVDIKERELDSEDLEGVPPEEVDRFIEEKITSRFFEGNFRLL